MSHIVTIDTQVRDPAAVAAAARRLKLPAPAQRTVKLYSGEATGVAVQLPGWKYPLVCQTDTGALKYDNYNGKWGAQAELDRFMQAYAVEKARIEARRAGHTVTEQTLGDGSIKLTVNVAPATEGGAA